MLTLMEDIIGLFNFWGFIPCLLQTDKSCFLLKSEGNLKIAVMTKQRWADRILVMNSTNFRDTLKKVWPAACLQSTPSGFVSQIQEDCGEPVVLQCKDSKGVIMHEEKLGSLCLVGLGKKRQMDIITTAGEYVKRYNKDPIAKLF